MGVVIRKSKSQAIPYKVRNHMTYFTRGYLTCHSRKHWGSEIKDAPPSIHYDEIMASDAGVGIWTSKIV